MNSFCPGAKNIKGSPTIKFKQCPTCGSEIEIFSNELETNCTCGFKVYNDVESCFKWCKYARECLGEDLYNALL